MSRKKKRNECYLFVQRKTKQFKRKLVEFSPIFIYSRYLLKECCRFFRVFRTVSVCVSIINVVCRNFYLYFDVDIEHLIVCGIFLISPRNTFAFSFHFKYRYYILPLNTFRNMCLGDLLSFFFVAHNFCLIILYLIKIISWLYLITKFFVLSKWNEILCSHCSFFTWRPSEFFVRKSREMRNWKFLNMWLYFCSF
jgi:hypothetical protein